MLGAFHRFGRTVAIATLFATAATATVGLALAGPPAAAQASDQKQQDAVGFIRTLSERAFEALRDPNLDEEQQRQRFRELLREGVAIDYVGKIVLGRFRRDATPEQLAEYEKLFPEYIIGIYTGRILQIGDEELKILGAVPQGQRDIFVRTQLVRPEGGPPISADWRVRAMPDGNFKIIDLKVEGISMAETKRDEFASLIGNRGFGGFLDQLRTDAHATSTG